MPEIRASGRIQQGITFSWKNARFAVARYLPGLTNKIDPPGLAADLSQCASNEEAMDGRLAIAFWLMSLASSDYQGNTFSVKHADAAHRLTFSQGFLQSRGRTVGGEARITYSFDRILNRFNPVIDFSVGTGGATFIGAGLYEQTDFSIADHDFFAGFSFIPGLYMHGNGFDLGYPLVFRSGMEFGFRTENGTQVSLSYDHRSNAGLGHTNPGIESIQLRVSKQFQ
jgi:hypothetical protein